MSNRSGKMNMSGVALAIVIVGLAAGTIPTRLSADDIRFTGRQEMNVPGKLKEARPFDFTGDGLLDIVALSEIVNDETARWTASLFIQRESGRFGSSPDRVLDIDTLATLITPAILPGRGNGILTYVGSDGIYIQSFDRDAIERGSERWIEIPTPVMARADRGPLFSDAVRDWDGDGLDEMIVYDFSGFSLLDIATGDAPVPGAHIRSHPRLGVYHVGGVSDLRRDIPLSFRYDFPMVTRGEYNGDGRPDLFIRTGDHLAVATQSEGGGYEDPFTIRDLSIPLKESDESDVTVGISLADFNGDGLTDFSETWGRGTGLTGTEAEIRLFLGHPDGGYGVIPDQVIEVEDAIPSLIIFEDLDGDQVDELIVPTIKLGLMSFVRILTSGVVQIKAQIFDDDPNTVYEDEPRYIHQISTQIEFSGQSNVASGHGNFNDDRNVDFAFGTRKDEISIYQGMGGRGNRIYSRDPVLILKEESNGFLRAEDLDGNGREDILLYYPSNGKILVYFSVI